MPYSITMGQSFWVKFITGFDITHWECRKNINKANLRDLTAVTGLVILLKLDSNRWFFGLWPGIWWMTLKNNRAPLLHYVKLCASFQSHWWIQTGVTVWKLSIQVKIDISLSRVTLKFDGWPWKTIGHLFYATSSFMHNFLQFGNTTFWTKLMIFFCPVWPWNLTDDLDKQ